MTETNRNENVCAMCGATAKLLHVTADGDVCSDCVDEADLMGGEDDCSLHGEHSKLVEPCPECGLNPPGYTDP